MLCGVRKRQQHRLGLGCHNRSLLLRYLRGIKLLQKQRMQSLRRLIPRLPMSPMLLRITRGRRPLVVLLGAAIHDATFSRQECMYTLQGFFLKSHDESVHPSKTLHAALLFPEQPVFQLLDSGQRVSDFTRTGHGKCEGHQRGVLNRTCSPRKKSLAIISSMRPTYPTSRTSLFPQADHIPRTSDAGNFYTD